MANVDLEPSRNVAAQGVAVGGATAVSRVSGLARDVVLAAVLGASGAADTFFLAFRIPNFFRRLFAEGAFAQAFVPVLAEYRERGSHAALREFVGVMAGNLGVALLLLTALGVLGAWGFAAVFMHGLLDEPERFALGVELTRIVFPYAALISLAAFVGATLNAADRYAVPAFTPVLLNVALIAAALFAAFAAPGDAVAAAYALAWGVLAAGAAQLLAQLPALAGVGLLAAPKPNWRHPGAKQVGGLFLPAVFAASAGQINALVGSALASHVGAGGPSWLYYADRLLELPIGVVAIALGTVLLPHLSRLFSKKDESGFKATLDWAMRCGLLLALPAAAALVALAYPLVATLFLHGATTARDADMIVAALRAFAVGLVPLVLVKIAQPGFFARQNTATPFRFAAASVAVNIAFGLATFRWLGHVGLALATSVAAIVHAALLVGGLMRGGHYRPSRRLARMGATSALATGAMVAALWFAVPENAWWLAAGVWERIGALALVVAGGLGVYGVAALALGARARDVVHRL